jgi:hypothetical protein
MRIKKHPNRNEYLATPEGLWVRNFAKEAVPYVDINHLGRSQDYPVFLQNEIANSTAMHAWIDSEHFEHPDIVIVSDGYDFDERQKYLAELPKNITIITVNKALAKWKSTTRVPGYYVVNNPYDECVNYLPKRIFPKCIASTRTNSRFLKNYRGTIYRYMPVSEQVYSGPKSKEIEYQIDDYRNPICAAIGLAYRFRVERLALFCCDDSFADERPAAEKLNNGLWMYPQQRISHSLIEANLYWLKKAIPDIRIINSSSGPEYEGIIYIEPENISRFFEE